MVTWASDIAAPVASVTVPKTVASCVCDHAPVEHRADDRASNKHALETDFAAAGKLPTITASDLFLYQVQCTAPCASSSLGRLFCRALVQPEFLGHFHQVCDRVGLHFLHDLASVRLHCFFADAELATDLFVQETRDHQRHDLSFPWSE